MFSSSLPPVVCWKAHVLFRVFSSSLPPVFCWKAHVLFRVFSSSLPPVVCWKAHVLFRVFSSSLPPVVCWKAHVLFTLFMFAYVVVCFLFCLSSSCVLSTQHFQFLWIVHFLIAPWVFNVYLFKKVMQFPYDDLPLLSHKPNSPISPFSFT